MRILDLYQGYITIDNCDECAYPEICSYQEIMQRHKAALSSLDRNDKPSGTLALFACPLACHVGLASC